MLRMMPPERTIRPIETETIARLYMKQGLLEEAESLFLRLVERRPHEQRLKDGLSEVRRRMVGRLPSQGDSEVTLAAADGKVRCSWKISEQGLARARPLLDGAGGGRLTVRAVSFPLNPRRPHQDIQVERKEGTIALRPPPMAVMVSAAVGLQGEDDRFVAIAHCEPVILSNSD